MLCVSQEHWPCGYYTFWNLLCLCICSLFLFLFFDWPLRLEWSSLLGGSLSLIQKLFTARSFLCFSFVVNQLPSAVICLLWISQLFLKEVIVSPWLIRKMPLSDSRSAVLSSWLQHSFFETHDTNNWRHYFSVILTWIVMFNISVLMDWCFWMTSSNLEFGWTFKIIRQ